MTPSVTSTARTCSGSPVPVKLTVSPGESEAEARDLDERLTNDALGWFRSWRVPVSACHYDDRMQYAGHLRVLDEISAPTLDYPAPMHGAQRAMLQFAGATVDGEESTVYPALLASDVRY